MQLQDDQTFDWTNSSTEFSFQNDFHFSNGLDDFNTVTTQFDAFEDFMFLPNQCFTNSQFEPFQRSQQVPPPEPMTFTVQESALSRPLSPVFEPMQIDSYLDSKFLAQETLKMESYFMSPPTFSPKPRVETPCYSPPSSPEEFGKREPLTPEMPQEKTVPLPFHPSMPEIPREKALSTTLNTNYFNDYCLRTEPSFREHPRLLDVSRPFSGPKYTEIFTQFGSSLLIDKHPQLSENDLSQIERTGFMYFLKNVKTIVPKIGPWKFQSHVRGSSANQPYDTDRSYNLVGSKVSIRCKVKEWVVGNDLWRMYHYVQGKSSKPARMV